MTFATNGLLLRVPFALIGGHCHAYPPRRNGDPALRRSLYISCFPFLLRNSTSTPLPAFYASSCLSATRLSATPFGRPCTAHDRIVNQTRRDDFGIHRHTPSIYKLDTRPLVDYLPCIATPLTIQTLRSRIGPCVSLYPVSPPFSRTAPKSPWKALTYRRLASPS